MEPSHAQARQSLQAPAGDLSAVHGRSEALSSEGVYLSAARYVRYVCGVCYLLNGVNWYFKVLPFPSMSDPVPSIGGNAIANFITAMIQSGWIFTLVKTTELITAIALLSSCLVPLFLVVSMTVVIVTFAVNLSFVPIVHGAFHKAMNVLFFGGTLLAMQGYLMVSYLRLYRPMLSWRPLQAAPWGSHEPAAKKPSSARAAFLKGVIWVSTVYVVIFGTIECVWQISMIRQWIAPWTSPSLLGLPT